MGDLHRIHEEEDEEEGMIFYDGLDSALIGYADGRAVYDFDLMVKAFIDCNDWSEEESREWISFNIEGAYLGEMTPLILRKFEAIH